MIDLIQFLRKLDPLHTLSDDMLKDRVSHRSRFNNDPEGAQLFKYTSNKKLELLAWATNPGNGICIYKSGKILKSWSVRFVGFPSGYCNWFNWNRIKNQEFLSLLSKPVWKDSYFNPDLDYSNTDISSKWETIWTGYAFELVGNPNGIVKDLIHFRDGKVPAEVFGGQRQNFPDPLGNIAPHASIERIKIAIKETKSKTLRVYLERELTYADSRFNPELINQRTKQGIPHTRSWLLDILSFVTAMNSSIDHSCIDNPGLLELTSFTKMGRIHYNNVYPMIYWPAVLLYDIPPADIRERLTTAAVKQRFVESNKPKGVRNESF